MDAHYSSRIKELVQLCGLEINMIFSLDLIANVKMVKVVSSDNYFLFFNAELFTYLLSTVR